MARNKDPQNDINDKYQKTQRKIIVKEEYELFLKERKTAHCQNSVEGFTISRTRNGQIEYQGFTERELINLLGGNVPDYY